MVSRSTSLQVLRLLVVSLMALFCTSAALAAPIAPSNLRGAVLTSTSFQIIWDDNSTDETGFFLVYSVNGVSQPPAALGTSTGTGTIGTSFSGLSGWNNATLQIRADNAAGSSFSNTVSLIFNTAFNAPVSPLTKANADGTLLFMWSDNASSEAGYIVEIATAATGPFSTWGTTAANATGISGGLAPSTTYYFRVKAFQGTAASPTATTSYSSVVSGTTPVLAPPTTLVATTASEGTVNLTWVDNCAVEGGYSVYYKPSSSSTYTLFAYAAANATTYSVTGLTAGTSYDFQVATAYQSTTVIESTPSNTSTTSTKDGFTSRTYQPITYNQAFSYQASVSTASARTSWNITGLPTGLTFNSSTGVVSGTPTVTGVFSCPMTATFANGWTTNSSLSLRIIRAPSAPVTGTAISSQTLANGGNTSVSLTDKFSDPDSESAVRVVTNLGTMDFILYNTATPQTVTNFLSYVNNASSTGNYNGAVFHRSVSGFVVQGGAFKVQSAPNNFTSITTVASPTNEPGISNLRGTVAMAKLGSNPNSATDQFFVNLADNSSNLDNQNGGFTTFARVAGNGVSVADAIAALPTVNSTVNIDGTANSSLTGWPVTSGSTMDTTKMVTITSAATVPVLSYSVTGNTNPTAVTASISGTNLQITGSAGGQSSVTVTATDLDGNTASQTFAVTVNQAPTITSTAPSASGTVGAAYNFSYTASGYPAPTFSVPANTLPPGLSLSSAGVISGTCSTAGTYTGVVTATNANGSNPQGFSITVSKGSGSVSLGSLAQTYDGTAKAATSTTTPSGLSVTYTYNGSSTAPTNAGSYTVVGTINDANYTGTATGTLVIAQATATVTLGSLAQTYDGTAKVATATTTPTGKTVNFTYNGSSTAPINAGSYTVVGTINDTNYTGTATSTLVISKATATVTLGSLAQTYDGTAKVATATTTPSGKTVTFTYNGSSTAPTNAGSYPVVGTISDTNYQGTASGTLVISQATATVTLGSLAQTYDGTAKSATATTTPTGKTVNFTYNGSSTAPTTAGSYTVVGTISDTNYQGTATGTLVISQATATVTLGSLAQTYDGTAKSATATTTPSGKTVNFTYNGSSTAPTNAGSYTVVGTISDTNYQGNATGTLVISQATATVTLGSLAQTYDGTAKSATATTTPTGKTVNFTYNGSSTAPTNAGSYTVVGTISDTNYTGNATGTLVISQATATVTLGSLAQTYDGTAKSATATTTPTGKTVNFTYNGSSTAPTTAGSYTVVGTISDTNYQGNATGTLVISQATATVTLGSLAQTYDGTAKAATATTAPSGKTVNFTYNGSSTAPTNAGSYTVVGTISDTNYQGTATSTLVISKATATVTLGSLAQTYDGTAKAATATTTPSGKTVAFTYNGSSTAPTNAGSYPVVGTISDTNYQGTASGTLVISQATATITLNGLTQTYDGTAKAVTATTSPTGLSVSITYNGSSTAPSGFGSYPVTATITDSNYTGTQNGTLTIQGQTSSSWKAQHFTAGQVSAGLSADNADPDGDTLLNLAEYALGTDPLVKNTPPQPTYDVNGLTLIFTRPKALPNVTYTAQSTDSLGTWNAVTLEVITDGSVQTIRARDPLTSGNPSRRFMRLMFGAQ